MTARDEVAARPIRTGFFPSDRPSRVVAVVNGKGGVGKTTLAHNLAVQARSVDADLPVLVIGLDGSSALDEMFAPDDKPGRHDTYAALQQGTFENAIRRGLYGVHYVPSSPRLADLLHPGLGRSVLDTALRRTAFPGLVLIDTKSDLGPWTQNAIAASDLTMVPVSDLPSLFAAKRVFELLGDWGEPSSRARLVLSMVDLRIKFQAELCGDVLDLLRTTARRFDLPLFRTFLARSPRVQALITNPEGRRYPMLHAAARTDAGDQIAELTEELFEALARPGECTKDPLVSRFDIPSAAPSSAPSPAQSPERFVRLRLRRSEGELALPFGVQEPLSIPEFPFFIGRHDPGVLNDLAIEDARPWQVSRRHAHLIRRDGRIGVVDLGSQRGTWVDDRQLGGPTADPGPAWIDAPGGVLVLGDRRRSPYAFDVEVSEAFVASSKRPATALSPVRSAALAALAN